MPHDSASSSGGNGVAVIESRRSTALPPGPGMFVSDGKEWRPALTAVTTQERDPINPERWVDVPVLDPKTGTPLMRVNPAAAETVARAAGEGATGLPIAQPPEPKDIHKDQMNELIALQRSSIEAMAESQKNTEKLIAALVGALAGKK